MGRRQFSREFKLEAVRLVKERGVSAVQLKMPNLFRDFEKRNRQRFPEWFQDAQPGHGPGDEEPPWVAELAARLDRLEVAAPVVVQAPAPRPWWSGIPWWVWLVAGFVAARLVPMPH